jgi:putative ABC transport system permease protein
MSSKIVPNAMRKLDWLNELIRDMRYSLRTLCKAPGFAVAALITLGLGIGATTAIFSALHAVLLKALPFSEPDRLVVLDEYRQERVDSRTVSWVDFQDWRQQNKTFDDLAVYRLSQMSWTGIPEPALLRVAEVSSPFFRLLGAQPFVGRTFSDLDDKPSASRTAVISYGLWKNRLGGDPNFQGRALALDGNLYSVIGILPPEFSFFDKDVDAYLPAGLHGNDVDWILRGNHPDLLALGKLRSGVSLDAARSDMNVIMHRLEQSYPQSNTALGASVDTLYQHRFGAVRPVLLTLFLSAAAVLMVASVNVANLLLARGSSRLKEMALRAALGASRRRLTRQLIAETMVLSFLGAVLGLIIAAAGLHFIRHLVPQDIPRVDTITIDGAVLLFALGAALVTGLLCGLAPALHARKTDINAVFQENSRGSGSRKGKRLRSALLVAETAIALVIVTAAGLVTHSLVNAMNVDPGFEANNLLALDVTLPGAKYASFGEKSTLFTQAAQRLRTLPGTVAVGSAFCPPLIGVCNDSGFQLADHPVASVLDIPTAASNIVTPGYFEAMQIRLLEGRFFSDGDDQRGRLVAIVNQSFARRYWPGQSAIGRQLREGGPRGNQPYREIVGVVNDVKQSGMDAESRQEVFLPVTQFPFGPWTPLRSMTFVLRTRNDPMSVAEGAKKEIQAVDQDLPVTAIRPVRQYMSDSLARRKFSTFLLGCFGVLALVLATVGTYGVVAYGVGQRTREIGTRMALGATVANVRAMLLREVFKLASLGIILGLVVALISNHWLATLLYRVRAVDPLTLVAVPVILLLTALLGSYVPLRRALRLDPADTLRHE